MNYHVVEGHRVDDAELGEVVFVGDVISMPGDNIKGRVILVSHEQAPLILGHHLVVRAVAIFIPRGRGEEVARVGKAIGTCEHTAAVILNPMTKYRDADLLVPDLAVQSARQRPRIDIPWTAPSRPR